jgi:hypothetical protein
MLLRNELMIVREKTRKSMMEATLTSFINKNNFFSFKFYYFDRSYRILYIFASTNFNGNGKQSEKRVRKIEREALTLASETDFLQLLTEKFPDGVVFSTSFSYEDQVITISVKSECGYLYTGYRKTFEQTYETWASYKTFSKRDQSLLSEY